VASDIAVTTVTVSPTNTENNNNDDAAHDDNVRVLNSQIVGRLTARAMMSLANWMAAREFVPTATIDNHMNRLRYYNLSNTRAIYLTTSECCLQAGTQSSVRSALQASMAGRVMHLDNEARLASLHPLDG
jgi:hypothetical protein